MAKAKCNKQQSMKQLCTDWERYPSIDPVYNKKMLETIRTKGYDGKDILWVASEKVHGANFSLITDGKQVIAGKRTSLLLPLSSVSKLKSGNSSKKLKNKIATNAGSSFFDGWEQVLNDHKQHAIQVFNTVKNTIDSNVTTIIIFGELFGGFYDLPPIGSLQTKPQSNSSSNANSSIETLSIPNDPSDSKNNANSDAQESKQNSSDGANDNDHDTDPNDDETKDENDSGINTSINNDTDNDDETKIESKVESKQMEENESKIDDSAMIEMYKSYNNLCKLYTSIQCGVSYSPTHHFYPFDVKIISHHNNSNNNNKQSYFLSFKLCEMLFKQAKFDVYAESLMIGTMDEIINKYKANDLINNLKSTIPQRLNLQLMPTVDTQISEGIVLRIYDTSNFKGNMNESKSRIMLKLKCANFHEICKQNSFAVKGKNKSKPIKIKMYTSPEIQQIESNKTFLQVLKKNGQLKQLIHACTNANRLNGVTSKVGKLNKKSKQKITKMFVHDIWDESSRLCPMMNELNKKSKRVVMSYISEVVKEFMAQRSTKTR